MNLYNNFNKQEKDLLAEANVTIENKEYSKDECKNMIFSIVDYVILSLARENIPFKEIIIDRKRYRVREQEVVTKNKIDEIIRRRKEFLNNNRIGYVKSTVRRLVK